MKNHRYVHDKKRVGKYLVTVEPDEYSEYEECGPAKIGYMSRSRYTLGDTPMTAEEMQEVQEDPDMVWLPVSAYVHSSATIWTGEPGSGPAGTDCRWDSGRSGIVFCSRKEYAKYHSDPTPSDADIRGYLDCVVKEFDHYLRGNVWGFRIVEAGEEDGEEIDVDVHSCWGFVGDPEHAMAEGVAEAEALLKQEAEAGHA